MSTDKPEPLVGLERSHDLIHVIWLCTEKYRMSYRMSYVKTKALQREG